MAAICSVDFMRLERCVWKVAKLGVKSAAPEKTRRLIGFDIDSRGIHPS